MGREEAPHSTLPATLTSFVGREREVAEIAHLLETARLVSLVGAGGCGKTRLALRVAADVSTRFAGGVFLVELARIADPDLVPQSVAKALNVMEQPGIALMDALRDAIGDEPVLLVLDNCEHVLAACAQLVEILLACPNLHMLMTSRELMGVVGEALYPVLPMGVPAPARPIDDIRRADAVKLFVARAQSILPQFSLTPDNAETIAAICRELDGIPLAIELASARAGVLSVKQIHERLAHRFDLLVTTNRAIARHRTLRAAIDWSYELLSSSERMLLQRLSLFVAGFSLSTAEAACAWGDIQRDEVLGLLSALVGKSLIMAETLQGNEARYRMLETIREYAQEKLRASPGWIAAHDHYLTCYLQISEEVAPKLHEQQQQFWYRWLETEYDNIRVALAWAAEHGHIEVGLRIGTAIYYFWHTRAHTREGRFWFGRLLEQAGDKVPLAVRVYSLTWLSVLASVDGDMQASTARGEEALALCQAAGDEARHVLGMALIGAATAARSAGDYETTYAIGWRVNDLYRDLGDMWSVRTGTIIQSQIAVALGKYQDAHTLLDEGLAFARAATDTFLIGMALQALGDLARCEGHFALAGVYYEECLSAFREVGAAHEFAAAQHGMAFALLQQDHVERAQALFRESLETMRGSADGGGVLKCLLGFAALASATGLTSDSARLFAAVMADDGGKSATRWPPDKIEYEHYLAQARAGLSDAEFEAAQARGRALSVDQAVDLALKLTFTPAQDEPAGSSPLSEREREVAALIAHGKTNTEIADQLFLSKRTVEKHVSNIMAELGFTQRTQIVRWAIENGLH